MPSTNPMKTLYKRLSKVGLKSSYVVETALPSWWTDEAAETPSGYAQAVVILSRRFGFLPAVLRDPSAELSVNAGIPVNFKRHGDTPDEDLRLPQQLTTQLARLIVFATKPPVQQPSSAQEIRKQLLAAGNPWIGLDALLAYCWSIGIPVVHVSGLPSNLKKMHGLAGRIDGRPVIVIAKHEKQPAWLLFILAHELGHIALGHVTANTVLVDQKVDKNSTDSQEAEANKFAIELLCGKSDTQFGPTRGRLRAHTLAQAAVELGRKKNVDPGHIVLNYAYGQNFYQVGQAALKHLDPHPDAPRTINQKLSDHLDWDRFSEDDAEFVCRMLGLPPPA